MVKNKGFNLIELLIVVVVVAVLAAIAYPSYVEYQRKANRVEAQAELLDIAKKLQRYKVANLSYRNGVTFVTLANIGETVPLNVPRQGTAYYRINLTGVTNNTWLLQAQPINNTIQQLDGALALNHRGEKCWGKGLAACQPSATTNWDGN